MMETYDDYKLFPTFTRDKLLTTVVYYPQEQFAKLPEYNRYLIGNYGTIIDLHRNCKQNQYIDRGYALASLFNNYLGKWKTVRVHRLVMLAHCPNKNSDILEINHIDGNKNNNIYDPENNRVNLEWSTHQENVTHYLEHGLKKMVYSEETIHSICRALKNGKTIEEAILDSNLEINEDTKKLVYNILTKRCWQRISDQYNLQLYIPFHYTEEHVLEICEMINQNIPDFQIAEYMSAKYGNIFNVNFISNIRVNDAPKWKYIIDRYNFSSQYKKSYLTEEEVNKMCSLIQKGYSRSQIHQIMGFDTKVTKTQGLMHLLRNNKIKKYQHITQNYFLRSEELDKN